MYVGWLEDPFSPISSVHIMYFMGCTDYEENRSSTNDIYRRTVTTSRMPNKIQRISFILPSSTR